MPTIDLASNQCVGAEALVRWVHNNELISPDEFIPLIENTALSGLLTYSIIEMVEQDLGDQLRKNENIHVGINIPPELLGRGGIEYAVIKSGLTDVATQLILEITERGFPDDLGLATLQRVNGRAKVAIDDFGTGDANLLELSKMHADIIKLDKYFIDQITSETDVPKIVKGLIAFAQAMEFEIIAEGVETEIQAKALQNLNVQMAQGWYFSKPLRANDFIKFSANFK